MNLPNDHIVKSYDEEQQRLVAEIVRMGEMAVAQLEASMDVIEKRDENAAHRIIANDEAIDSLEQQISHDVMRLALRGPMARDLREILAGLRIPADIERIGDYAANVAKRSIALGKVPPLPQIQGLRSLGRLAAQQVRRAIAAYRDNDADAALELREDDARLDAQYTALFRELLTYMMEDPRNITRAPTCCSWPRTWSAWATTPPTSPRTCGSWCTANSRCRRARSATRPPAPAISDTALQHRIRLQGGRCPRDSGLFVGVVILLTKI